MLAALRAALRRAPGRAPGRARFGPESRLVLRRRAGMMRAAMTRSPLQPLCAASDCSYPTPCEAARRRRGRGRLAAVACGVGSPPSRAGRGCCSPLGAGHPRPRRGCPAGRLDCAGDQTCSDVGQCVAAGSSGAPRAAVQRRGPGAAALLGRRRQRARAVHERAVGADQLQHALPEPARDLRPGGRLPPGHRRRRRRLQLRLRGAHGV